jgi:hypothetical protein
MELNYNNSLTIRKAIQNNKESTTKDVFHSGGSLISIAPKKKNINNSDIELMDE